MYVRMFVRTLRKLLLDDDEDGGGDGSDSSGGDDDDELSTVAPNGHPVEPMDIQYVRIRPLQQPP